MSKFKILTILIFIVYTLVWGYDKLRGNSDGILSGVYFHRLFLRILILTAITGFFIYLSERKKSFPSLLGVNALVFIGFFLASEILSFIYIKYFEKSAELPSHILFYDNPLYKPHLDKKSILWGDVADSVGKWRVPNSVFKQINCEDKSEFVYKTNSKGLRDIERSTEGPARVAFVGDSYVEGFMIPEEGRLSNLLEKNTGVPHINLSVAGANPTAYYLIYKKIAKPNYDHDRVIIGICQGNDFDSFNHPINGQFLNTPIYRGFWNDKGTLAYTLKLRSQSSTSLSHAKSNYLRNTRDSLYREQSFFRKVALEFETNSYLSRLIFLMGKKIAMKKYNEKYVSYYEKPDWGTSKTYEFTKSFDVISKEIDKRPLLFVIIPTLKDVKNYKKNKTNQFTPYLKKRYPAAKVVDLIEVFAQSPNPEKYYITCDGHWNLSGHKLAADYVINSPEYQIFLALKP